MPRRLFLLAVLCSLGIVPTMAGAQTSDAFEIEGLKSPVPASWKEDPKMRAFRLATWVLEAKKGEKGAEVYVSQLGPGGDKLLKENIKRWQGMFKLPEGKKDLDEITKVSTFKVGNATATLVDIEGLSLKGALERRVNVLLPTEGATYYFILHGPASTVREYRKEFEDWVRAFK